MMKGRFSQESYLLIPGYGFEIVEKLNRLDKNTC